ncbi:hypothetical protein JEOAER750_00871 [Jeotgalicoccus aerolatus]|uniref:Bacterial Pleckstrin homology domain-containing protein n=1 Tax=Jeotgalicoccus aerolatus TaxID=709510 RepID=A0ABS4HP17_9STAP|nr:PH domain-containing protein [Jeotgalicoccus aerolatus]MBP1952598.1 hypothetical protein [Jeotgalicoccus aerolatus]GGD92405.1 hypothetical protein GCM10007273_01070 [Jeotgalicoccus aerolatus]CAD2074293.1 hypothetical protein JEOAER750_00871 [Jeotgalicoccus aerolatus]
MNNILEVTLLNEITVPEDIENMLVNGEEAVKSYKTFRDSVTFTTKRIILRDSQGVTGKKVELYSISYNIINMWSSENARGMFDMNAELELWTRAGQFKIKLDKKIDIREIDMLIANATL